MDIQKLYELYKFSGIVSTDTRQIEKGCLYFGLKGDNFDGASFAKQALEKGASYVLIQNKEFYLENDSRYILVEDTLEKLQELALFHRRNLKIPVIAICGSNGKTTSKELIFRVLSKKYKTFSTPGNFNNHIGVPLSLLKIQPSCEIVVLELGANHQKEHELLLKLSEPDFALVTNIGKDHLEGFGGIEGVEKATNEVFDYLRFTDKHLFINTNDSLIVRNITGIKGTSFNLLTDGFLDRSKSDFTGKIFSKYPTLSLQVFNNFTGEEIIINSNFFGTFNSFNILAAACIGNYFGVTLPAIKVAVEEFVPDNNRSQILKRDSNTYILDAYNANPSSMTGAISDFTEYPGYDKILILGDMFELGEDSFKEHLEIVKMISPAAFHKVIFVGNEFSKHQNLKKGIHFSTTEELKSYLLHQKFRNMLFLLKGSRGMKLESILEK